MIKTKPTWKCDAQWAVWENARQASATANQVTLGLHTLQKHK